jgi:phosphohistidine phosphatase SixA
VPARFCDSKNCARKTPRIGYHPNMLLILPGWFQATPAARTVLGALLLIAAAVAIGACTSTSTTTVVLVRHAERQGTMAADPPLSPEGMARAQHLASLFGQSHGEGRIDAIYVTDTRRTQQTAAPLAADLGLRPIVMRAADVEGMAARVLRDNRGEHVLIVAHSNTVPTLIHELSGLTVPPIGEDEYGHIYIVTLPARGAASLLHLTY